MFSRVKWVDVRRAALTAAVLTGVAVVLYASMGRSFQWLMPGYTQHLWGVSSLKSSSFSLGGVVVLQDGTVVSAECRGPQTRLHIFDPSPSTTFTMNDTLLHKETTSAQIVGGCGLAFENVGGQNYIFSNLNDTSSSDGDGTFGIARISWPSLSVTKMAANFPGNGLGIAVDPVSGDLFYLGIACRLTNPLPATCPLYRFNPSTLAVSTFASLRGNQFAFIDSIAFEPTRGDYLVITNRTTSTGELDMVNRSGQVVSRTPLLDSTTTGIDHVGIGFHGSPAFVATNNQDGTMTEYDYPGGYEVPGIPTRFASGGSRGDMIQTGPDGCLYVTQLQTAYNDPTKTDNFNSIVQICSGFLPPPGITPNPPPRPSSICGFVYDDVDNDGVMEPGEPAIGGVKINFSGTDYLDINVPARSVITGGSGDYCFGDVAPGHYTIAEEQPSAYLDGKESAGKGSGSNDTFTVDIQVAAAGGAFNGFNFGELLPSSLGGYVYLDVDNNGSRAGGEAGIAGVAIALSGSDDRGAAVNMPATTGVDGSYLFRILRPGTYTIAETQPPDVLDGKDTQGTPGGGTPGNDVFSNIRLEQGIDGRDNNFGELPALPKISLVKKTNGEDHDTAPGPVLTATTSVTWTYIVRNTGLVAVSSVAVMDDKEGAVVCPKSTLAPNEEMACSKTGTVILGPYTNTGTVTATDGKGHSTNASNVDHYVGVEPPSADLGITATAPANATAGGTFTYTLNVINNGVSTANNAVVAATLPAGMRVTALGMIPAGWVCVAAPGGASVTCTKPTVAKSETASLSMTISLVCPFPSPAPALSTLMATISAATSDPSIVNNTATRTMSIVNAAPVINGLMVDKAEIWPPNHKMVPVTVSYTVTAACGGTPTVKIDVDSNEGDVSDWKIEDAHHLDVRSERLGTQKEGRVYTITVTATDPTGTYSQNEVTVRVPHDQGHGK